MKPASLCAKTRSTTPHRTGSSLVIALLMLTVLAAVGGSILLNASRRYNGNLQAQAWQEALFAAEGGADLALANLRWTVVSGSPTPFDTTLGWATTTSGGNTIRTRTTPVVTGTGDGATQSWAVVTVDSPIGSSPAGLQDKYGTQWYRIRSTGHVRIPGLARAAIDPLLNANARHDNTLRKFNLRRDRSTGAALAIPEATRTIETIIQPKTAGGYAIKARTALSLNKKSSYPQLIDSYDSGDPTKSTGGLYDPAKRQSNGHIYADYPSSKSMLAGAGVKVYGNAGTNGGTFTDPNKTIQSPGTINNNTKVSMPVIPVPTWGTAGSPSINPAVTTVTSSKTITVLADPTKNYYALGGITAPLTIALAPGVTNATLNIWLKGDVTTKGAITIAKGVKVNIYFTGGAFHPGDDGDNVGSIDNLNKDPSTFTIYGCGTATGSGPGIDLHVGGEGVKNFYGTVYAPYRLINLKYDGKTSYDPNSAHYGSFVGNSIIVESSIHYDESLGGGGVVTDYKRVSYVEDPR